jgi:hypothetical protein
MTGPLSTRPSRWRSWQKPYGGAGVLCSGVSGQDDDAESDEIDGGEGALSGTPLWARMA